MTNANTSRNHRSWFADSLTIAVVFVILFGAQIASASPVVVVKLDDLKYNNVETDTPVINYLARNKIHASFGIIAEDLQKIAPTSKTLLLKAAALKDASGAPLFEFWCHGLHHSSAGANGPWEFSGTSYAAQLNAVDSSYQLVKKVLGIDMHTFGAPYNKIDANCLKALGTVSSMKVLLFGQDDPRFLNLKNRVNMETSTGVVDSVAFATNVSDSKVAKMDYIVIQGHPHMWNAASQAHFKGVLRAIQRSSKQFTTPYAYYMSRTLGIAEPQIASKTNDENSLPISVHPFPRSLLLANHSSNSMSLRCSLVDLQGRIVGPESQLIAIPANGTFLLLAPSLGSMPGLHFLRLETDGTRKTIPVSWVK